MNKKDIPSIFIPLGTVDKSRLRVLKPDEKTPKAEGTSWFASDGRYLREDGVECEAFFELPEQFCFGVNPVYPMNTPDEDKIPENMTGLQICYPITSSDTMDDPTKEEQYCKEIFDALFDVTWEKLEEECDSSIEEDDRRVPEVTYSSYVSSSVGGKIRKTRAIKPPYNYPMKKDDKNPKKKIPDTSKYQRSYIKLLTQGQGRDMKCNTPVYGPGDKKVSAFKFLETRGKSTPVLKWEGVYWGAHGNSPYGTSIRLRVSEMNYVPQQKGANNRRMLGPNTAPEEEDDSDDEYQQNKQTGSNTSLLSNDSDEEFPNPEGDEEVDILSKGKNPEPEPKPKKPTLTTEERKKLAEERKKLAKERAEARKKQK